MPFRRVARYNASTRKTLHMRFETVAWSGEMPGRIRLLDQTRLPLEQVVVETDSVDALHDSIRRLVVRGAPAIGVAAAYGVVLAAQERIDANVDEFARHVRARAEHLNGARPTAVNLAWAVRRMLARLDAALSQPRDARALSAVLLAEARAIHAEDARACERMGELGARFIADGDAVLTHCNAGALATGGIGSALAPIYHAHALGRRVRVYADETRPLLQGARLTAWELAQNGVDVTLITDNMAARVMAEGRVRSVFVGADRIARNGDVCNKIGTYGVALAARAHAIPFYVVAPLSTFDARMEDGSRIPIEERDAAEVTHGFGRATAPAGVRVYNPAFDVTPARLVTAIVTEAGVIEAPDEARVLALLRSAGAEPAARQQR